MPAIPDRRLELMLVCTHPAIAHNIRTPLMLQAVLGVEARDRRGVRRSTGDHGSAAGAGQETDPRRRHTVRDTRPRRPGRAVARGAGGDLRRVRHRLAGRDGRAAIESLSAEALHLAVVLTELPDEPEVLGLAALVCLSEARRPARRTVDGSFVPLDEQDTTRWDATLRPRPCCAGRMPSGGGRFQYEAAIQSAHCDRARSGHVDWGVAQAAPCAGASRPVTGGGGGTCRGGR